LRLVSIAAISGLDTFDFFASRSWFKLSMQLRLH
jgi:hypothetical protein